MPAVIEQEKDIVLIRVTQYVTDGQGIRVAAIVDIEELRRVEELIEDLHDLRIIAERKNTPTLDYEEYSARRKARINAQAGV
ncbi:MAG: hypothetical protein SFH39_04785 [Candidatus Magnetobacterium sp. LHC-1]|nr:hypothetical protein [Nitrospirota bacterium]